MYKECLSKMSSYELKNQVEQLLNYSPNFFSDNEYCIGFMLYVFAKIFEQYTKRLFCFSIQDSAQCILYPNNYATYIKSLVPNNKNSFILVPLISDTHLFTCVILKTDSNYECTIVNKGASNGMHSYTQYIISENQLPSIVPYLGFHNNDITIGEVYDLFNQNSISCTQLTNIYSSRQKINNCYYKEFEAGLKYAYSNCYLDNFNVPKWPTSTLSMHQQYISFVMELDISKTMAKHLKNLYDVYTANKTFRAYSNENNESNFSLKKILPARLFYKHKDCNLNQIKFNHFKSSFGYDETSQSTFEALYNCICLVDLKTLKQNLDFFEDMFEHFKLEEHALVLDRLEDYILGTSSGLSNIAPSIKIFFPNVIHELTLQYSGHFDSLSDLFYKNNDMQQYFKCLEQALLLHPTNTLALSRIGDFYFKANDMKHAIEYFSKALNLVPRSQILLEKRALAHIATKDFKNALRDCSKLEQIAPNNIQIPLLKSLCKSDNKELNSLEL